MMAFDADIASELLYGNMDYVTRASALPPAEQFLPIVVVEEILRGRMSAIRRAESGKRGDTIERAYALLHQSVAFIREFPILPYTDAAEQMFQSWRSQKIRIGTHDLRIAAIVMASGTRLISRNRVDFDLVPNLHVEYWP